MIIVKLTKKTCSQYKKYCFLQSALTGVNMCDNHVKESMEITIGTFLLYFSEMSSMYIKPIPQSDCV